MNDELGSNHNGEIRQNKLDAAWQQMLENMEAHRSEIYDIAEDCRRHCEALRSRLQESKLLEEQAKLNLQVQNLERLTHKAEGWLQRSGLAQQILAAEAGPASQEREDHDHKPLAGNVKYLEAEHRKIAHELHDGPAQIMASILLKLDLIEYLYTQDRDQAAAELANLREMSRECLGDIRRIMFDLKPGALKNRGLKTTLQEYFHDYAQKHRFTIDFKFLGPEKRHAPAVDLAMFRLVQEAIANVRKHSGVTEALVTIEETPAGLTLMVKDNGRGFNVEETLLANNYSFGIPGMKERVELLGGSINIISHPKVGTQIRVELPAEGEPSGG